ncbi:basic proline-rich protein-like [Vulpes lagopus]|uniref:basic proline-rich protein-like n=1 Tax=Vulpes lagopus TaxID=494514 RepID=UPI001BC9B57A|nr:basic proline-rich protein-like [Vulpes lagopus]XP_041630084.1 basic proline-rich protein-like [Vulpes lagopus]XP_041630085.1 basic proline-rich protein-like [Vulpes lagopus]
MKAGGGGGPGAQPRAGGLGLEAPGPPQPPAPPDTRGPPGLRPEGRRPPPAGAHVRVDLAVAAAAPAAPARPGPAPRLPPAPAPAAPPAPGSRLPGPGSRVPSPGSSRLLPGLRAAAAAAAEPLRPSCVGPRPAGPGLATGPRGCESRPRAGCSEDLKTRS